MAKKPSKKNTQTDDSGTDPISHYAEALTDGHARICRALRTEIDAALSKATAKIWHGGPVWFIEDDPVVGYSVTAKGTVNLLFWNGQSFGEPALKAMGKFRAAQVQYHDVQDVDLQSLARWLKKAGTMIWDYEGIPQGRRPKSRAALKKDAPC